MQQAALTPAYLRKMELETTLQIYTLLKESKNKVIIIGDPSKVILNQ